MSPSKFQLFRQQLKSSTGLWARKGPTKEHKKAWSEFNHILELRSIIGLVGNIFNHLIWGLTGTMHYMESEKFVEECSKCNKELVSSYLPYFKMILNVLMIGKVIMLIVAYWHPKTTRFWLHYLMIFNMINQTLPNDYGNKQMQYVFMN